MATTVEESIESAIAAIDLFLTASAEDLASAGAREMRTLASRIHATYAARRHSDRLVSGPRYEALHARYRAALEKLSLRLEEMERALYAERDRALQQQTHLARTREWHQSLSSTQ